VASGTQAELARTLPVAETLELELVEAPDARLVQTLAALPGVRAVQRGTRRANLEDVFLALTGRQLRD
jgi:hypothetical protein